MQVQLTFCDNFCCLRLRVMLKHHILINTCWLTAQTRVVLRRCSHNQRATSQIASHSKIATVLTDKLNGVTKQFDSVLGITEVRTAQSLVQTAEDEFMKSRRQVEETRNELIRLQNQLRELRSKLDRIPREDERYLQLATEEHKVLIAERKSKRDLETLDTRERDHFSALSAAVRGAHEKERSRAERTKYWSIIASACGAVIGILGSTIINMKRMKQIRLTVKENNEAFIAKTMEELRASSSTNRNQRSNDFLAMLNDNSKMLEAIDAKVEKFSSEEIFASKVKELVVSCNENNKTPNLEDPSSELHRCVNDLTWWTKASLVVTVASSACMMLYIFSK